MFEIIKKVINEWDPMGLVYCASDDEYECEIREIEKFILNNDVDVNSLGKAILDIFIDFFDKDLFNHSLDDCKKISKKLLDIF